MLQLTIPSTELFNDATQEFVYVREQKIQLEHSLISISKWESKWRKPFIGNENPTEEEMRDYVRNMTLTPNVDPNAYFVLGDKNIMAVRDYIEAPMTATVFGKTQPGRKSSEFVTSELIYYWMVAYQIPFECQKWHLNRLLTLIRICDEKNRDPKSRSKQEIMRSNAALNEARKKAMHTKG